MTYTYRLVMRTGPNPGQIIPLDKTEYFLGRDLNSDIVVNDSEVSRKHSKIYVFGQGFVIEDLGSTNGTFVNGQRISGPHNLIPGELIALGDQTTFVFEVGEMDEDATRVAAAPEPVIPQPTPRPVQQQYQQPVQAIPMQQTPPVQAAPPAYSGNVPSVAPEPPKKKRRIWLILIILVVIVLCLCLAAFWAIDSFNWYCDLVPGVMNAVFGSGTCP